MKKVYVCGDSFCVSDLEYGECWVDLLGKDRDVTSLAQVSATNTLISMQVDQAIAENAEFIIVQGTSCTRGEKRHNGKLHPFSYHTASKITTPFDSFSLQLIKEYYTEFFDLDLAIYQNKCIIENTLQKLVDSRIPFLFDQGGFEHLKFGAVNTNYFQKFDRYKSKINLWSYTVTQDYRPYYHITDAKVHREITDYYLEATR
jgi:hypothetical protein